MDEKLRPEQLWGVLNYAADEAERAGRYAECLGLLQQALRMADLAFGKSHRNYAFTLIRLADTFMELNRYDDAEEHYNEAIPILKRCLGEMHLSVGISYRNLADLYERLGKRDESLTASLRATQILKSNRPRE